MSDAKQNLPLPEGACSVTCPSCHLTIVHEKPRPLPPDAVSGAATPAQQCKCGHPKSKHLPEPWGAACMHNGGECQCAEYVEPAATPEAQIPECVHAPRPLPDGVDERLKYLQPAQYASWLKKAGDPDWYEHRYRTDRDRWMLSAIRELRDTRAALAALRVERDRALEAAKLLLESHCCDTGEVDYKPEWIDIWTTVCDACRPVRSLVRPIPAEKLE